MLKTPDNSTYPDARNALDLTLATGYRSVETWSDAHLKKAIASSKLLREKNRDQPRLAKHAIAGSVSLAILENHRQNYQESARIYTDAAQLLELALSDHRDEAWVELLELQLLQEHCVALLGLEKWTDVIQSAQHTDDVIKRLQNYMSPDSMPGDRIRSFENQAKAYRHLGREDDAKVCEESATQLSREIKPTNPKSLAP